jgi:hypothetical protein
MRILQIVRVGEKMGGIAQVARQYHFLAQKSREFNESPSLTTLADCPSETFLKHFADIGAIHAAGLTKGWRQFSPRAIRLYSNILSSTDLVIAHTGTCMPVLRIITALDLKRKVPLVGIVHNDNSLRRAHRYDGMICLIPKADSFWTFGKWRGSVRSRGARPPRVPSGAPEGGRAPREEAAKIAILQSITLEPLVLL